LRPDWQFDQSFEVIPLPNGRISAVAIRPAGEILLGGSFMNVGKSNWMHLVQVRSDLTYDAAFNAAIRTGIGFNGVVSHIDLFPDGKALLRNTMNQARRMNQAGGIETTFTAGSGNPVLIQADGKILAAGTTTLGLFDPAGVRDQSFAVQTRLSGGGTFTGLIHAVAVQESGMILMGGEFALVNDVSRPRLARLFPNGVVDTNFVVNVGTNITTGQVRNSVMAIAPLPDGDILIGGNFAVVGGKEHSLLARLGPDGELRDHFNPGLQGERVDRLELLPDGDVLVKGKFLTRSGPNAETIVRLRLAPENRPPVIQIHWPTNGTEFRIGDGIPQFELSARAYDPDGFVENLSVWLDGTNIVSSNAGQIDYRDHPRDVLAFSAGPHEVIVVAEDASGLRSTNSVTYNVTSFPFPFSLSIRKDSEGAIVISEINSSLEESDDLRTWQPVTPSGESEHRITPDQRRFYRLRSAF
jgi:hypothetical protein